MKLYQDREWLYQKYIVEKLTVRKIGELCKVCHVTILYWLHKFNIPIKKEEVLEKIRLSRLGKPTWNKGLTKATSEAVRRISEAKKGESNPMYGKMPWNKDKKGYFTKEALANIHLFKKGFIPWNKDKIGVFSKETIRKMRLAHLRFLKKCKCEGGQIRPSYNSNACKFFSKFNRLNNTNGMHAKNGGEYHIKELGYFVDYFNPDLKIIIEWDERKHYRNGKLRKKDIERQKEIENLLPDYKFIRIREEDSIRIFKMLKPFQPVVAI